MLYSSRQPGRSTDMHRHYYVHIVASGMYGTLYLGVTNDLARRVWEHKNHVVKGFSERNKTDQLVRYEVHEDPSEGITREKQIKNRNRDWKVNLIQRMNPSWEDLYESIRW
jgi:putative endonuclease